MTIKETIAELAETAETLYYRVQNLSKTELEDLWEETQSCESKACDLSCELDSLNDHLGEFDDALLDYIPDYLSAGEAESLKEVLNKWRTDNGYPAK